MFTKALSTWCLDLAKGCRLSRNVLTTSVCRSCFPIQQRFSSQSRNGKTLSRESFPVVPSSGNGDHLLYDSNGYTSRELENLLNSNNIPIPDVGFVCRFNGRSIVWLLRSRLDATQRRKWVHPIVLSGSKWRRQSRRCFA